MKNIEALEQQYERRFGYAGNPGLDSAVPENLRLCIVIPCLNEDLEETLVSIGSHPCPGGVELLLVLNHSEQASTEVRELHEHQIALYKDKVLTNGLKLHVVKAFDLPVRHAGVGLARKIGMDIALKRFAHSQHDGLIVCLDGDCRLSNNYLEALLTIEKSRTKGLSITFEHDLQKIVSEDSRSRIVDYEIWLRYYVQALRYTGYPHAFHTIGSSMAVRASTYARIGGMNRRKAGEDFYFLHKLIPHGDFYDLVDCKVYPSARTSTRVPFGTGRAMLEMAAGQKDFSEIYNPKIFQLVREWWPIATEENNRPEPIVKAFKECNWNVDFALLRDRSSTKDALRRNFEFWFDGFKMLKLVHFLRDKYYPNTNALEACSQLLGLTATNNEEMLLALRGLDEKSTFAYF